MSDNCNSPDTRIQRGYSARVSYWLHGFGVAAVCFALSLSACSKKQQTKKDDSIRMVELLPPPPPPPPPPPQQKPKEVPREEPKMVEQTPVEEEEKPPEPEAPKDEPAPLGTGIKGDGTGDNFGLTGSGRGGGLIGGRGNGSGKGGRSKWGWYAGQVQSTIADALRNNRRTRNANLRLELRIWSDASGRITRAKLAGSSGNPEIDRAIEGEVLTGLRLKEPPPQGMPMPIVMRVTAKRPN